MTPGPADSSRQSESGATWRRRRSRPLTWSASSKSYRRSSGSSRPPSSVERALLNDPAVYEDAGRDPEAWWAKQAEDLHWFQKWESVVDDSNPPFFKWFTGGKLNVSHNCLDRHVDAGLGDRVAIHWRGEGGEERDISYADLHQDVQRFANALKASASERAMSSGSSCP